jgi:serine protein kinase
MKMLDNFKNSYNKDRESKMSIEAYLTLAKKDKEVYLSPAERILKAIGKPVEVDTAKTPRLSRIFGNRVINQYDAFKEFHGLEDIVERIVSFFKHSAQNLEESRQILYLLGPVGSAKSSLVETLKKLMETQPVYILADEDGNCSPINESPLGLITKAMGAELGIDAHYITEIPSPWAVKRLKEYEGDISRFNVVKKMPSQLEQICITKTEPGDENNQDISALVGKVDIRKLDRFGQDDADAYLYCGGLCQSNQGMLDFVEMFKAPIKMLHPLLTATQEHNFKGTESISAIPYNGVVVAHSNESEWTTFKANKNNEAFLDRVYIVEVPYCLQVDEEVKIYKKLLSGSTLSKAPIAPNTLEMLAEFCVLSRLEETETSSVVSKMRVYNGQNVKDKDSRAKSFQEYKDMATSNEGFFGISTRMAYKVLAEVFNYDGGEISADPVHLLYILERTIDKGRYPEELERQYLHFIKDYLAPSFAKKVEKDIQTAYLDSYSEYGQSIFDRYITFADHWVEDNDYRDADTGQMYDRVTINKELDKLENPAGIVNSKDFRHEVVNFALRYQAQNGGVNPKWTSYEKLKRVIEATMFSKTQDLLPVISFTGQGSNEDKKKHDGFIDRMIELGYTERQVKRVVEWQMRYSKSS